MSEREDQKTPGGPAVASSSLTRAGSCSSRSAAARGHRGGRRPSSEWDRHDRLSTISALTLAPHRQRFGLYWALCRHNIRASEVLRFLRNLRRHRPRGFVLIWDRGRPHRAKRVQTWLAAYAPHLNPVEHVWVHTKYIDLANPAPPNLDVLETPVVASLAQKRGRRPLLASFF